MKFLTALLGLISFYANFSYSQECTELFISEITHLNSITRSGNTLSAVEIYNPTDKAIILDDYSLQLVSQEESIFINLYGTINSEETIVVTNSTDFLEITVIVNDALNLENTEIVKLTNGNRTIDIFGLQGQATSISSIDLKLLVNDPTYITTLVINIGSIRNVSIKRSPLTNSGTLQFQNNQLFNNWILVYSNITSNLGIHGCSCNDPVLFWKDVSPQPAPYHIIVSEFQQTPVFGTIECSATLASDVEILLWQPEIDLTLPPSFLPAALLNVDYTSPNTLEQPLLLSGGFSEWEVELFTPIDDCQSDFDIGGVFNIADIINDPGGTGVIIEQPRSWFTFLIDRELCTNTKDILSNDQIKIFPTLVNNELYFELKNSEIIIDRISILDSSGKLVHLTNKGLNNSSPTKIDLSNVSSKGLYLIQIHYNGNLMFSKRILKM